MNQKQMEYFLEVYRQGNMQSAADKLYVSRQGVSKMLKTLEEELGQLLFIRNPHGLVPTDYANALLPHVQRLLAEYRSIASMSTLASQSKSVVTIYALDHIMAYLGAEFLWDFHQACPDIILSTGRGRASARCSRRWRRNWGSYSLSAIRMALCRLTMPMHFYRMCSGCWQNIGALRT